MGMPVFFRMPTSNLNFSSGFSALFRRKITQKGKMHGEGSKKLQIAVPF
jgi:hypothetical protein